MRRINNLLILLAATALLFSCQPSKEKRLEEINNFEIALLKEAVAITDTKADTLLAMYDGFIREFPQDTNSAIMLYKASDVAANIGECDKAVLYLERLMGDFPDFYTYELAYFKLAQVYDDVCLNKDKAKRQYELFIDNFPNSKLSIDARVILEIYNMADEFDLIREFEEKNKDLDYDWE